jgi:phosphatidylserine/phosphatidylglycerophosphate/cardiolipin synthase-like enzyme
MPDPFAAKGSNEENRMIYNALLRSRAKVRSDFNGAIFHQKFVIRDGAEVLTGSTNFTLTGVHSNLNHIVIIRDREVSQEFNREFTEINRGQFGRYSIEHSKAPKENTVSGIRVKVLFAPDHNPEMEIMKQIAKARQRIDFAIFTFSKSSGIDDAIIQARRAGVQVRGVFDAGQGNQKWAATRLVKNAGVDVHLVRKGRGIGKLHHKLMVIDGRVMIVGSFNYTGPANQFNDENVVLLGEAEPASTTVRTAQPRLTRYALDEIDRIIRQHAVRLT